MLGLGGGPALSYRGIDLDTSTVPGGSATQEQTTDDQGLSGPSYPAGVGQSVTFGSSPDEVTGVRVRMARSGDGFGLARLAFYAVDGSSLPTGAPLAVSPVYAVDQAMSGTAADYYFPLSGWTPTGSTQYAFGVEMFNYYAASVNGLTFRNNSAGGYAGGANVVSPILSPSYIDAQNSGWFGLSNDLDFSVYEDSTPDVTAPVLSSPTGQATGATSGQGQVTTDEGNGTLYWVVTQSATQPSVAQIQAGQDHTGSAADADSTEAVSASGVQTVNAGGLAASTAYFFHYQQEDSSTNDSNRVSSTTFSTPAASSDDYDLRFRDATYRRRYGWGSV